MDAEPLEVIRLARESTAAKIRELLADTAREFSIHQNAAMNRQIEGIPGTPAK
jgi:hypothetical protein